LKPVAAALDPAGNADQSPNRKEDDMFGTLTNFETLFDELRRLEQGMGDLFGRGNTPAGIRSVARGTFPAANVGATDQEVQVYLFAPGLDARTLQVTIQQNLLLVSGARKLPVSETATYYRQERFDGEFRRVVTLPDDVDAERVDARYRDGVLQVSVKRREAARPRQIEVK
jgi:HSP20 family protein